MTTVTRRVTPLLSLAAMAAGLALAGAASAQIAPAEASGPPPVTLSTSALQAASEYRAYIAKAQTISPNFTNGPGVESSLSIGESFEPQQLSKGEVAYAALIALQDPTFVAGVRTYAVDPGQRRDLAARIEQDPAYATVFPGAANAAGAIIATLGADGVRLGATGGAVKQSAYSVQHFAWSKSKVIDPAGRLSQAKATSSAAMAYAADDVAQLKNAVNGAQDASVRLTVLPGAPVQGPYTSVVQRGLALAAVAALGEAGDDNDAGVQGLMTDQAAGACLNMSKLNLYQCLAVAGPWYEDIFCLGEHGLSEPARCIVKGAATSAPAQLALAGAPPTPPPIATPVVTEKPEHVASRHSRRRHRRAD